MADTAFQQPRLHRIVGIAIRCIGISPVRANTNRLDEIIGALAGSVIAIMHRGISLQFPVDRAAVPSESLRDLRNLDVLPPHRCNCIALLFLNVLVVHAGSLSHFALESKKHNKPRRDNPYKPFCLNDFL